MTCHTCTRPRDKQTIDGVLVCNFCETWRAECEARAILKMPSRQHRINHLDGYTKPDGTKSKGVIGHRGEKATKALKDLMMKIWRKEQA